MGSIVQLERFGRYSNTAIYRKEKYVSTRRVIPYILVIPVWILYMLDKGNWPFPSWTTTRF